jgi:hypothetical protein
MVVSSYQVEMLKKNGLVAAPRPRTDVMAPHIGLFLLPGKERLGISAETCAVKTYETQRFTLCAEYTSFKY